MKTRPRASSDAARLQELENDPLVQFLITDSLANVLCPACKLWNTGHGANMMREAVSLMGGYGITEDCPGFLGQKWMDAQLEATYEGPEAVQRRQLSVTMTNELFLAQFRQWITDMREIAGTPPGHGRLHPGHGHGAVALDARSSARKPRTPTASRSTTDQRQGVTFPLADALCWLLASRCQILDVLELEEKGPENPVAGRRARRVRELLHRPLPRAGRPRRRRGRRASAPSWSYGYKRHPAWDDEAHENCFEGRTRLMPSMRSCRVFQLGRGIGNDASRPTARISHKAGPCVDKLPLGGLRSTARQAGRLPDRFTPGQGPRGLPPSLRS